MLDAIKLKILPRCLKRNSNGFAPFQENILREIKKDENKIIFLNAPVGAGKSFIARQLLLENFYDRASLVLIYPTKILMEAQVGSLIKEVGERNLSVWPYDDFKEGRINIFLYSTDALIHYLKKSSNFNSLDRSNLLNKLLNDLQWFSKKGAIITSPDVLYLLKEEYYRESKRKLSYFKNSIFVFDEFHQYYGLNTFPNLVDFLCEKLNGKILLLSATGLFDPNLESIMKKYNALNINFYDDSLGNESDICFNYNLDLKIDSFKIININETKKRIVKFLLEVDKPCAVIFDSVFRLRHIKKELIKEELLKKFRLIEWSGFYKDNVKLNEKSIVLGTSAIEVGIDMKFNSAIIEATYWPSTIQRMGRVGRKGPGTVVLFTRKDFNPFIKNEVYNRTEFEEDIIKNVLNVPKEELSNGITFRGESFNFILFDEELKESFVYNENLFAMYEIDDEYIDNWRELSRKEKITALKDFGIKNEKIEDLLLYDLIIPFWGILKGRLKDNYEFIEPSEIIKPNNDRNELIIKGKVFYGG